MTARRPSLVQAPSPADALIAEWNFLDGGINPTFGGAPVTFSRAAATATRVNASGLIEVVAADTPRFDYDPVTRAARGLLIEGARANKILRSEALATAPWNGGFTVTNDYATVRGLSFSRLSGGLASSVWYQPVTYAGDGTKCASMFVKQDGGASGLMNLLIYDNTTSAFRGNAAITVGANGVVTAVGTSGGTVLGVESFGDDVYRVLLQAPGVVAANDNRIYASDSSGATLASVLLAGVQTEDAAFPSSYIPTTSAAVTRNADDCSVLTSAIAGFSASTLSMFAEAYGSPSGGTSNMSFFTITDADGNNSIYLMHNATTAAARVNNRSGGTLYADFETAAGSWPVGALRKVAYAAAVNDVGISISGAPPATHTSVTMPVSPTTVSIGSRNNAAHIHSHLRKLRLYNRRISNAELQALTA